MPGFSNVWLKDESTNPTGTHKDRMAWEMVVTYREILLAKKRGQFQGPLPQLSVISFGSTAIAVQTALRAYGLPSLKVLYDRRYIKQEALKTIEHLGAELYETDLTRKVYTWKEILALTQNEGGFDITSNQALDPTTRFYDWMSYEIINTSPDYVFIPFGTGNLYENILNIAKKEATTESPDPRFSGNIDRIRRCNFMGATTHNPNTRAEKLYSPHLPFVHYDEQWIRLYHTSGFCGSKSGVYLFQETFLEKAMRLAHDQGIATEPSGIAGLALLLQIKDTLPRTKKLLVVNTGKTKYIDFLSMLLDAEKQASVKSSR